MSLVAILKAMSIDPIEKIYAELFLGIYGALPDLGGTIVLFSLVLNLLLLPVYYQMERAGRAGREIRARVQEEVDRMRRHFRGRERYFYIRAVHRQFGYRPISAVFSAGDLYVQILVFATVYRFLLGLPFLSGASFAGIPDLSRPDGLLFGWNLLPLLMTLANVASAVAYHGSRATRLQSFALAVLFLVLLYRSPSGIVLYWTCNNVFSLVRNVIERTLVPKLPVSIRRRLGKLATQE